MLVSIVGGIALATLLLYIKEDKLKKEDWKRLAMHLPWGLMAAALFIPDRLVGFTAFWGMLGYEGFNDLRKGDKSYKDVLGIVWGFLLGAFALWGLRLL